eukprot:434070_1
MSSPFKRSHKLPINFNYYIPKPIHHPTDPNCIIISSICLKNEKNGGIYKYNILTNESQMIYKYDDTTFTHHTGSPSYHGQFIDPSNNTLVLYGGFDSIYKIFDLNTNQMQQIQWNTRRFSECDVVKILLSISGVTPQSTFIPPINEIHILSINEKTEKSHYKFNVETKEAITLKINSELPLHFPEYPKLVYIKELQKLYVFGGKSNDLIFSYNNNKWIINKLTMPYSRHYFSYDILNEFNNILLAVYFSHHLRTKEIFILDLLLFKWYKSEYSVPNDWKTSSYNLYAMKKDNEIYIFNFKKGISFQINIYDIIPREIIISNRRHFKSLIMGYIREKERELSFQKSVPPELKMIILNYFPLF